MAATDNFEYELVLYKYNIRLVLVLQDMISIYTFWIFPVRKDSKTLKKCDIIQGPNHKLLFSSEYWIQPDVQS